MVGVVAHQARHVEGGREPRLAVLEQVAEALVRLLGGAEARELPHRPQLPAVHRRVDAARVRDRRRDSRGRGRSRARRCPASRAARSRAPRSSRRARPAAPASRRRAPRARRPCRSGWFEDLPSWPSPELYGRPHLRHLRRACHSERRRRCPFARIAAKASLPKRGSVPHAPNACPRRRSKSRARSARSRRFSSPTWSARRSLPADRIPSARGRCSNRFYDAMAAEIDGAGRNASRSSSATR